MSSIRLEAQIWATARRTFYSRLRPSSSPLRSSHTLPAMFSRILLPSPSYPSFSVSFAWLFFSFSFSFFSFLSYFH